MCCLQTHRRQLADSHRAAALRRWLKEVLQGWAHCAAGAAERSVRQRWATRRVAHVRARQCIAAWRSVCADSRWECLPGQQQGQP